MRKITILILSIALLTLNAIGQIATNTFPDDGNVGIGITNPEGLLQLHGDSKRFIISNSTTNLEYAARIEFWEHSNTSDSPSANFALQYDGLNDMLRFRGNWSGVNNSDIMVIKRNGKVGIGTTSPSSLLDLYSSSDNQRLLRLSHPSSPTAAAGYIGFVNSNASNNGIVLGVQYSSIYYDVITMQRSTRNVGIGTTNPAYKLTVDGTIGCEEVKVENIVGADFVFEEEYELRSLNEVEEFIKTNKHLPEVTSAKDMEENGIDIGEFQIQLLQKIEELTLYVIELKKENDEQRQINAEQTQLIKKLIENTK